MEWFGFIHFNRIQTNIIFKDCNILHHSPPSPCWASPPGFLLHPPIIQFHNQYFMIKRILTLCRTTSPLFTKNIRFFAKPDKPEKAQKPQKGGKPEEPKPVAVVQVTPEETVRKYLATSQEGLSPNELQILNQGFADLSENEKRMLESFADEILEMQTPSYIQFVRRGGLGTSEAYWVATKELSDQELSDSLKYLRKE